ncbi:hypothetical protein ILUMI_26718 [Ignelater luminosus]|uniref:Uncharacterized protein n=1 Tax=Ignelater luminosus TaxID=2038154 RepID=A0A8K0C7X7_IGNLU|nr:hypothetical protein ILUMI_26718 [Ignelater luminosus]
MQDQGENGTKSLWPERLTQKLAECRSDLTEGKIRNWFKEINDYLTANNLRDVVQDPIRRFTVAYDNLQL